MVWVGVFAVACGGKTQNSLAIAIQGNNNFCPMLLTICLLTASLGSLACGAGEGASVTTLDRVNGSGW